jgi:hypothetical protein
MSSYGNVSVRGTYVLRGCRYCRHSGQVWLPEIRKHVLYLDQFFFSAAFRRSDARFVDAVEKVSKAASLQLLVAPFSSVHEDETHQWRGHKDLNRDSLMEFIKATSRGAEFEKAYNVERTQITKAWSAFLKGGQADYVLEERDAIRGELHTWNDYFRIDVGGYTKDIELKRSLKSQAVDGLIKLFDEWQHSTQTFEQDVALEMRDAAKNYLNTYLTMAIRLEQGDVEAVLDSPIVAKVVKHMLHWLPDDQPLQVRLGRCIEFFKSEHFRQVPNLWISARIFGTLKDMVKRGAYAKRDDARNRLSGVFEDIKHISLYAPYCHAFVMDTPMADLVRQPTVGLEQRFGVKVFSLNNWDDFAAWLDSLVAGMSDDHKAGVVAAYPTG